MGSYRELQQDWSTLHEECGQWSTTDLQLAAELGKTLLERNKELETSLRQHQNVIEDQTQEIEYLTKQTAALREVNDSRLRIYEQLEVSIQDLERANQRLSLDNSADKKQIKSLGWQVESLEGRCDELTRQLDELHASSRRVAACVASPVKELPTSPASDGAQVAALASQQEQHELLVTLQELRSQRARDRHRLQELEEQLAVLLQENACLEEHVYGLQQKEEDVKSLQEELSSLEELRQEGQLCRRCLRIADDRSQHAEDDDDEISIIDSLVSESQRNSVLQQLQESLGDSFHGDNPYRVLVEKYEELLKVQRPPGVMRVMQPTVINNCLTLQEELQMSGEFDTFPGSKVNGRVNGEEAKPPRKGKLTPTDFSETETSSSGFSDETSNKGTQTDTHFPPGSFLCTISDGEDCRFSIYDDASPVESRFRKTPEYRQLFREIFDVLKRAAEAKDEGEKLPLLDDFTPVCEEPPKVPPVTPAREDNPALRNEGEESEDDLSFGIVSEVQKGAEVLGVLEVESATGQAVTVKSEVEAVTEEDKKKSTNDILEYFASGSYKKKSNKKHSSKPAAVATPPADPVVGLNAKVLYTNKVMRRRKERTSDSPSRTPDRSTWCVAGSEMSERETKRQSGLWGADLPPPSAASQEVAKLRMLEKSYAEVLRLGRQKVARQQRK